MKKYILMPVLAALSLSGSVIQAQDFDNKPVVNVSNAKENLNFTIGARFMMDGAYYPSDFTPVKSGAAITDARIRTSMRILIFPRVNSHRRIFSCNTRWKVQRALIALKPVTTTIRHQWQTIPVAEVCTSFPVRLPPTLSRHPVSWG